MQKQTYRVSNPGPDTGRGAISPVRRLCFVVFCMALATAAAVLCLARLTAEPANPAGAGGYGQYSSNASFDESRNQLPDSQQVSRFDASRIMLLLQKADSQFVPQLRKIQLFWFQLFLASLLVGLFLRKTRRHAGTILFNFQTVLIISSPVRAGPCR